MATVEVEEAKVKSKPKTMEGIAERCIKYMPMGATSEIELNVAMVKKFLTHPTKSGQLPGDADVVKFMMLCQARGLNPWESDAYLTGYDSNDGPQFSLITSIQALLKRAELCPEFDGVESGIIVAKGDELIERAGTLILMGEHLIGGWARCWRKDRSRPYFQSVMFTVYNTGRSRWAKDPTGMIQKVAKAHVLREAFPNHLAGLKTHDEMERVVEGEVVKTTLVAGTVKTPADLTEMLKQRNAAKIESSTPSTGSLAAELLSEIKIANGDTLESLEADVVTCPLTDEEKVMLTAAVKARRAELN